MDVDILIYNIDVFFIEVVVIEKLKVIMIVYIFGNVFNLSEVCWIVDKYNLWLIEDCCDVFGMIYEGWMVGIFGDIGIVSFYLVYYIIMGEGGVVFIKLGELKKIIELFCDWGWDCYCVSGCDNICGKCFG